MCASMSWGKDKKSNHTTRVDHALKIESLQKLRTHVILTHKRNVSSHDHKRQKFILSYDYIY